MKRISAVLAVGLFLLIITPYSYGDPAAAETAKKTGKTSGSTNDSLFVTLKIPLDSPQFSDCTLAVINDDPVTVDDLTGLLAASHQGRSDAPAAGNITVDLAEAMRRLINMKLIVQEAQNVGLDELPEVKKEMDNFSKSTLRQLMMEEASQDAAADDKDVEKLYQETVREWKLKSVVFPKEEDAAKAAAAIRAGGNFDEVAGKALKAGTAKGSQQGEYLRTSGLSAEVFAAVSKLKVGSVSPVIKVNGKEAAFTLVKLEDIRYPENAAERERARSQALILKKNEVLKKYVDGLFRKYVTLDKKLLNSLDYESKKTGFEKFLEDKRVVAKIAGEKPVTVGDLTLAIKDKFFHGVENQLEEKKVNAVKAEVLNSVIRKTLFLKEALRLGMDKKKEYRKQVKEREQAVLFGMFIDKVVTPKVKFGDEDLKAYYQEHLAEYTYPAMIKLDGLAFDKQRDAESALNKLKKKADFTWIKENAEGQTDKDAEDVYAFGQDVLTVKSLPEDMQKALTGAKPGDFRVATGNDGRYYVLSVLEVIPGRQQTLEEVIQTVAEKVFFIKLNKSVEEWCSKLRNAADVTIFLETGAKKAS